MDWNPEFSRRARGFATYAALRELGRLGVRELVERCCDCAAALVTGLGELEGVTVLRTPVINQGLVCFPDPSGAISNEWNDAVIAAIAAEGTAYFSGTTTSEGRRAMRVSVCNWQRRMKTSSAPSRRSSACSRRCAGIVSRQAQENLRCADYFFAPVT